MLQLKMQSNSPLTTPAAYITLQKNVLECCKFHELAESRKFYFPVSITLLPLPSKKECFN